jgi:hypothetical protein
MRRVCRYPFVLLEKRGANSGLGEPLIHTQLPANRPSRNMNREDFLVEIYRQMFADINRHILVVWQNVGAVLGAFALLALAQDHVVPLDWAIGLILLICIWLGAHLVDASYWHNRNLAIIANVERQFLVKDDLKQIHYYFGKHRPDNVMIEHLSIQAAFGIGIAAFVLLYHFISRVAESIDVNASVEIAKLVPDVVAAVGAVYLRRLQAKTNKKYIEFLQESPGIEVDTAGTEYGPGHGFPGKTKVKK